jgi:hypothetical protein
MMGSMTKLGDARAFFVIPNEDEVERGHER